MSKPSKEALRKLAKASGGIQSRYGEHFGYHMSTVALERFAEKLREPLIDWIVAEGERTDICTKGITGKVCDYCRCEKLLKGVKHEL